VSRENVEIVRALFGRMARGELVADDMIDPNIEHVRIGFDGVGLSGEWRGADGLWAAVLDVVRVFDAVRFEGEQFIEFDSDGVFVRARHRGVGRISGAPFAQETAHVFKLQDGRIVRWEVYADVAAARKAAGLIENDRPAG
jgi:ketosteroid isomerase-like protein